MFLNHFGFESPAYYYRYSSDSDGELNSAKVDAEMSLYSAWQLMQNVKLVTLCVTDEEEELTGLIEVKDLQNAKQTFSKLTFQGKDR